MINRCRWAMAGRAQDRGETGSASHMGAARRGESKQQATGSLWSPGSKLPQGAWHHLRLLLGWYDVGKIPGESSWEPHQKIKSKDCRPLDYGKRGGRGEKAEAWLSQVCWAARRERSQDSNGHHESSSTLDSFWDLPQLTGPLEPTLHHLLRCAMEILSTTKSLCGD